MELRPKSRRDPEKGRQEKIRKKKGGKVVKITKEERGKGRLKRRNVEDDKGRQGTLVKFRKERRREEKRREVKEEKVRRKKKKRKKTRRKRKRRKK